MLEIICLIYLTRKIGELAVRKGLPPTKWKWITVGLWFLFEFIGAIIGIILFGTDNFFGLSLFMVACAFGGYLLVRYILEKKPDDTIDDEINRIGVDSLRP